MTKSPSGSVSAWGAFACGSVSAGSASGLSVLHKGVASECFCSPTVVVCPGLPLQIYHFRSEEGCISSSMNHELRLFFAFLTLNPI